MSFSHGDIVDLIFGTLEYDKARGGHTPETLLDLFQKMGICNSVHVKPFRSSSDIRVIIADLLRAGNLGMRSNGVLFNPEFSGDPSVEHFLGAWWTTTQTGHVKGPFKDKREARNECSNVCS